MIQRLKPFARAVELAVLATMLVGLPLAPLLMAILSGRASEAWRYPESLRRAFRHVAELNRSRAVSRYILWRAGGRPSSRLAIDERIEGECTHCGRCCTNGACVFVRFDDAGRSSCGIHGTRFWRWLSCGSYPVSRDDIELYRCPSFRVVRIVEAAPRPARQASPGTAAERQ